MTEDEQQITEWEEPPPELIKKEEPEMSEGSTLFNIFIEPGRTFEDLRKKPRFLLAGLIILIAVTAFNAGFIQKVGFERLIRERIESNQRVQQLTKEQKEKIIAQQSGELAKTISYIAPPIVLIVIFLLGGLIYWLGANAMGGTSRFLHGLSVWIYSSLPPTLLFVLANLIVLFLKPLDEINLNNSQNGLMQANPNMFFSASPALAELLSAFDLFAIWGWVLAAIGLQKVAKISSGAAWAIVLILGLVAVTAKVVIAYFFG